MRLGVIADIHANLMALEAVLHDLRRHGVDAIVNLGDCAAGPLWPAESVALLRASEMLHVRGNHDRAMGASTPEGLGKSDRFAWQRLTPADRDWLFALPTQQSIGDATCFHACPGDDLSYLMETVIAGRLLPDATDAVASRLAGVEGRVLLCGHSHLPRVLRLPGGAYVVNPGSVGCPAYHDDKPPGHVSESGSPHARYAVVTLSRSITVEHHAIAYDWDAAAAQASANGRDDWAHALLTGTTSR